ncbi:diguanylate cyclase (GGDEF)-like protein [Rhizobium sp. PP-F2F-G38]|nr:diguanylate cyclase (GGDEF)-like protein [Rhizobium sp. PP-WC-1G-195]PYE98194.1 diguanylate cyclase (GGDEF)-like protein [Rhizobium sp. PP-F2F-G38]
MQPVCCCRRLVVIEAFPASADGLAEAHVASDARFPRRSNLNAGWKAGRAMRFVHLRLIGPAIGGVALFIAAMATVPYYGAARIDGEARVQQETLVERNLALWIADIEFALTSWTIWDEAIAKLDNTFDFEWTDRNVGASLIGTSRTRFAAVLKPDDSLLYARTDETVKSRPFFARGAERIVADAEPLVADVRKREAGPKGPGIPKPIAISRIEVIGQDAVLLSASLFQPDFGTAQVSGARAPVLITAMPIGSSLQDFFGTRFLLDDARVSPLSEVAPERARSEIAIGTDGEIQVLSWRPPTPARDMLYQATPLVLTVFVVLLVGGFLLVRISQTTAQMLVGRERMMTHAATHDVLTGLANRALLDAAYLESISSGPFVVACIDLDGFKGVNDTFGHAIGDDLLRAVATRLRANTRDTDRLFRLGGDEFAILMPSITISDAEAECWRLGEALSAPLYLPGAYPPGHRIEIAASFGLCHVTSPETSRDAAFRSADDALYQAKSLGRGRVVVAETVDAGEQTEATGDLRRAAASLRG